MVYRIGAYAGGAPRASKQNWMGGRVVECTGLENRQRGNSFVGSNPTSSASFMVSFPGIAWPQSLRPRHAVRQTSRRKSVRGQRSNEFARERRRFVGDL